MFRSTKLYYRSAFVFIVIFSVVSFLLSAYLTRYHNVIPIDTELTATQYIRLYRRGVTAPQLLRRRHQFNLSQSDSFCADLPSSNIPEPEFLFLLIVSSWENTARRDHIRQTWATYPWFKRSPTMKYSYKFILSQQSPTANYTNLPSDLDNDDILISPMNEHYYLLDMKVLWGFSTVLQTHNFQYILKCDDDTFVNLQQLPPKILRVQDNSEYLYGGHHLSTHRWTGEIIPYAAGSGYVMSRKALCAVVLAHSVYSVDNPRIPIEDAYVGLLNTRMGISLKSMSGFNTEHESCKDFSTVIFHHIDSVLFKKLLVTAINGTRFC